MIKIKPVVDSISNDIKFLKYSYGTTIFYQILDNEGNKTDDFISNEQYISQIIGKKLRNDQNTIVVTEQVTDYSVLNLNSFTIQPGLTFINKYSAKKIRHFLINDTNILSLQGQSSKGYKFYGGDWRLQNTYEEVIENGKGIDRLGVLRLDVDNLGKIFKDGLGNKATFGRVVQLSAMLDFFFSSYINKLSTLYWSVAKGIDNKKTVDNLKIKDLIEIVYSGGDDVFIVGHWSLLPDIALWINSQFKQYTCGNPNFSVSAGIYLFDDKYPIYKAALETGEYENNAKKKGRENREVNVQAKKNGICFLDKETPISWEDFGIVRNHVKTFYEWIETGKLNDDGELKKISKGLISRFYSIYEEYKIGKYQNWAKWRWRAAYSLNRLGKQYKQYQKEIENFSAELFISNKTEQELINMLYIIANWTDLLTRKKEN
jgi:CRISPR-associated protein Csm1